MTMPVRVGVHEGDGSGLVAAGVLVGVVADDGGVADDAVDAAVDAGDGRGDLVDGAVEVVDAALQGDGELDEVLASPADERLLCLAEAPDSDPGEPGEHQAGAADDDRRRPRPRRRRCPRCARARPGARR